MNHIKNYDFGYPPTDSSYTVTSIPGHLWCYEFSDHGWDSCDPVDLFEANVRRKVASDNKAIVENLMQEARKAEMVVIWTGCDREGENIGGEAAVLCRKANRNIIVRRAHFSAITAPYVPPLSIDIGFLLHIDKSTTLRKTWCN